MNTVDACTILDDAYHLMAWDATQLETTQLQAARMAFSNAFQEIWESWWWQELMVSVQVPAATVYTEDTAFNTGAFCYFPATRQFYQAMQPTTGNDPATLVMGTGWAVNYTYWAPAVELPEAGDYSATPSTPYALGNQVRGLEDGLVYQFIQPDLSVSGAGYPTANGTFAVLPLADVSPATGKPTYYLGGMLILWNTGLNMWVFQDALAGHIVYASASNTATPDLATGWFSTDNTLVPNTTNNPVPVVVSTGTTLLAPPNAEWGNVTAFSACVQVAGTVRAIGTTDPRNSKNSGEFNFEKTLAGYRIPQWCRGVPWVWYRRPTPIITGDAYDATVAYTQSPVITFN